VLHVTAGVNKPQIAVVIGQHGAEWGGIFAALHMLTQLTMRAGVDRIPNYLIENHEFVFIIPANPDGFVYTQSDRDWRKNRRDNGDGTFGVDLNRNWDWNWASNGSTVTSNSQYRGTAPLSEPETLAIDTYLKALPRLVALWDVHTPSGGGSWPDAFLGTPGGALPTDDATAFSALRSQIKNRIDNNGEGSWTYNIDATYSSDAGGVFRNYGYWVLGVPTLLYEAYAQINFTSPPDTIVPQGRDVMDAMDVFCNFFNFT
jgi:hypothetical protein